MNCTNAIDLPSYGDGHRSTALGIELARDGAPNEYGCSETRLGSWWHAVDLITAGLWRELLDTARFTTPGDIAGAVAFGLQYSPHEGKRRSGYVSTAEAREIMAAINSPEPADRERIIREHFSPPSPVKSEKGAESWPINHTPGDSYATAWGHILGIETGWFAHDRAGFLGWTKAGRERFPPRPVTREPAASPLPQPEPLPEPVPPAEPAKALADEIGPKPRGKGGAQLDFF